MTLCHYICVQVKFLLRHAKNYSILTCYLDIKTSELVLTKRGRLFYKDVFALDKPDVFVLDKPCINVP